MAYDIIASIGECTLGSNTYSFVHSNPCAILTKDNIVTLCDDVEITDYTANSTILTLPNSLFYPPYDIIIPIIISTSSANGQKVLKIKSNGQIVTTSAYANQSAKVRLNGLSFNVAGRYYNPTIGNIYNNGTSPLSAE